MRMVWCCPGLSSTSEEFKAESVKKPPFREWCVSVSRESRLTIPHIAHPQGVWNTERGPTSSKEKLHVLPLAVWTLSFSRPKRVWIAILGTAIPSNKSAKKQPRFLTFPTGTMFPIKVWSNLILTGSRFAAFCMTSTSSWQPTTVFLSQFWLLEVPCREPQLRGKKLWASMLGRQPTCQERGTNCKQWSLFRIDNPRLASHMRTHHQEMMGQESASSCWQRENCALLDP